jgi:hypothetical protein
VPFAAALSSAPASHSRVPPVALLLLLLLLLLLCLA